MTIRLTKAVAIAVVLLMAGAAKATGQVRSPANSSGTRIEAATFFGAMIAGKEIGRGINATGGERLIAALNHGGALGVRVGLHNDLLGVEGNLVATSNRAVVRNEFGVAFPNHAEKPLLASGDVLFYPLRKTIRAGRVRPYVTSGVGGLLLLADLDNIRDKEAHGSHVWNAGGGLKVFAGEGAGLYFDLRFTNHRLLNPGNTGSIDLRSISVGVGARF